MTPTLTESGKRRKLYYGQFAVTLTPMERMYLQYYSDVFHRDEIDILRGMIRTYVESDDNFDAETFVKWAEKVLVPSIEDDDDRKFVREQLRAYKKAHGVDSASSVARKV